MPTLALSGLNVILSALGGWLVLFGLVSYLCKETLYLSEALISLLVGVAFSPAGANWLRPLVYAGGSQAQLDTATLAFSRVVLDVQLVLAGVQLPARYLWRERGQLGLLLGPLMVLMWLAASFVVWLLVPTVDGGSATHIPFLHALAIGACITPTDPVLSNVIVHGRFADQNLPQALRDLVVAESGANDGLGYPFLFLALYLLRQGGMASGGRVEVGDRHVAHAVGLWFGETLGYTILLSVVYGAVVGYVALVLLRAATARGWVERESFVVAPVALALFVAGTGGLLGTDDVLASFVAGNVFTWDDWFRRATHGNDNDGSKDIVQPTVDMVLNVLVFLWYGAVCPWSLFAHGPVPLGRLVGVGVLVLLVRRLPWLLLLQRWLPAVADGRLAVFVGFFGPMGVSAIFYLYVTLEFLDQMLDNAAGSRPDVAYLGEATTAVVWFACISSVVAHGLAIPLGMAVVKLPGAARSLRARPWSRSQSQSQSWSMPWSWAAARPWVWPSLASPSSTSLHPSPPRLASPTYPSPLPLSAAPSQQVLQPFKKAPLRPAPTQAPMQPPSEAAQKSPLPLSSSWLSASSSMSPSASPSASPTPVPRPSEAAVGPPMAR